LINRFVVSFNPRIEHKNSYRCRESLHKTRQSHCMNQAALYFLVPFVIYKYTNTYQLIQ